MSDATTTEVKVADILEASDGSLLVFRCPGCDESHSIYFARKNGSSGPTWTWNGSLSKPTIQPSILVTYPGRQSPRCHSFVTDGQIQYLPDSTHPWSGKTVAIPPIH